MSLIFVENAPFPNKKWASISVIFVENASVSKKKWASISHFFVENALFSNKKWASISLIFVENAPISNKKWAALKKYRGTILTPAFWHFRVTFPPRFEGRRVGRVGGLLFRTHSQQRARASRGQKKRRKKEKSFKV